MVCLATSSNSEGTWAVLKINVLAKVQVQEKNGAFMNKKKKRYLNHLEISKVLRPKGMGVRMVYHICI